MANHQERQHQQCLTPAEMLGEFLHYVERSLAIEQQLAEIQRDLCSLKVMVRELKDQLPDVARLQKVGADIDAVTNKLTEATAEAKQ